MFLRVWRLYSVTRTLYELRRAGAVIKLEPQVFAVLAYLVQHSDRVASKHELLERLWPDRYVSDKALVRCIQKARRVIGDDSRTPACIQTLHGRGYRFIAKVVQYAQALEGDFRTVADRRPMERHARPWPLHPSTLFFLPCSILKVSANRSRSWWAP